MRYVGTSTISEDALGLATTAEGILFDGFAEHSEVTARALACVAHVAATRFYVPANMVAAQIRAADPVVTSEPGRLRFEAFSQCCGVHARYDLLPDGLDERTSSPGTTNVDFSPETTTALGAVTRQDPLRLTVGTNAVSIQTLETSVTERRVPLPQRWIHGFGEVQVAAHAAEPVLRLDAPTTQRFIRALPAGRAGQNTYWTASAGTSIRLSPRRTPNGACVAGPARLRILEPLIRYAHSLTAYTHPSSDEASSTVWVLELPGARLSLSLSPDWRRGFTGEGGLLLDLAQASASADARTIVSRVADRERFSIADVAAATGLADHRCRAGLASLSLHGEVGHDIVDQAFFWRHLPYPAELLAEEPPRLRDARRLVDSGAVEHKDNTPDVPVHSDGSEYRVRLNPNGYSCTCPWVARHGTTRGPCKHVLAALLARQPSE